MAYKGGLREKATLLYEKELYTPEGAKTLSDKDLRKEYSRLRSIARKRLERFEGTEWTDTQIYKLNVGVYKPLKQIESDRELRHLFSDIARFVKADVSSVSTLEKQRNTAVQTLNDRGYEFVTKENYRSFAEFLEYARVSNLNKLYDSKRVADFYNAADTRKLSSNEMLSAFRSWNRKQKKLKKIQNIDPRNSSQYRSQLEPKVTVSNKPDYDKIRKNASISNKKDIQKELNKKGTAGWKKNVTEKDDE